MAIRRSVVNIVLLILYIAVGIPIISSFLMPMVIDFIMSGGPFLTPQWCSTIYRYQEGNLTRYVECTSFDLRPVILFIVQIGVYVVVPISLVFGMVRRR